MRKSLYREVECETCGAKIGEMCGRQRPGASAQWQRTEYHAARKQRIREMAADAVDVLAYALHQVTTKGKE